MKYRRPSLFVLLTLFVLASGCKREEAPPAREIPRVPVQEAPAAVQAPAPAQPTEGGDFNKFFPKAKDGTFERVFTQEKTGFALAEILRDGKKVALLSITTLENAGAPPAQEMGSRSIAGFPVTDTGTLQTSIVVGNRFKVVARSTDTGFTRADRDHLIESVDLKGLAALAGGAK